MRKRPKEPYLTEDCEGCKRLVAGILPRRPHLDSCRKKMYEGMGITEKGRNCMGKANEKIVEYLESKVREGDEKEGTDIQEGKGEDGHSEEEMKAVVSDDEDLTLAELWAKRKAQGEDRTEGNKKARNKEQGSEENVGWKGDKRPRKETKGEGKEEETD